MRSLQLYLHDRVSTVTRPGAELKGFSRADDRTRRPETVTFTLGSDEIRRVQPRMGWAVEPGRFEVRVGPNSMEGPRQRFEVRRDSRHPARELSGLSIDRLLSCRVVPVAARDGADRRQFQCADQGRRGVPRRSASGARSATSTSRRIPRPARSGTGRAPTDRAHDANHRDVASIAATGFGLTGLCIAAERGWLPRRRLPIAPARQSCFLDRRMPHEHGWFHHFVNARTGARVVAERVLVDRHRAPDGRRPLRPPCFADDRS